MLIEFRYFEYILDYLYISILHIQNNKYFALLKPEKDDFFDVVVVNDEAMPSIVEAFNAATAEKWPFPY